MTKIWFCVQKTFTFSHGLIWFCSLLFFPFFLFNLTAAPVLMQILTPQGQPTGQIQYIQFLRPVMMPLMASGYMHPTMAAPHPSAPVIPAASAINPQYTPSSPAGGQFMPVSRPYATAASTIISSPVPPYRNVAPVASALASDGGFYPYVRQQPVAAFSNPAQSYAYSPVPFNTGPKQLRLVNGPTSHLELNTNEYLPAASETSFSVMKPLRA